MGESRDEKGEQRFLSINPYALIPPGVQKTSTGISNRYWSVLFCPHEDGEKCCSERAISFHFITPKQLYVMDYFIYKLKINN